MKSDLSCMGFECPNRNQCMRYTHKTKGRIIRKCTNKRYFLQDEEKINGDSLRK